MPSITETVKAHQPDLGPYEELCKCRLFRPIEVITNIVLDKWFHTHPELSFQEKNTAEAIVKHLETFKVFTIHSSIGGHGIAASFSNGPGKTILLRADTDALPVEEQTGLQYASTARMKDLDGIEKPVMHACGHDMHITSLLAAAECLVRCKDEWSGELILVFQPAEERAGGAQNMV